MFKYLSSLFLAVSLLFAAQAPAQTFAHYAGASGKPFASNVRFKVRPVTP